MTAGVKDLKLDLHEGEDAILTRGLDKPTNEK